MLRLKQIDLFGFKSFCNRERLQFSGRGIAAVVGPNGCGKSNICDAVNWVLGEQSVKSLRGARMRDVIFAGTKNRPPSGLATVTLTLHDTDRVLERFPGGNGQPPSTNLPESKRPGEIAVTRKLFSNGQSQYILNGRSCACGTCRTCSSARGWGLTTTRSWSKGGSANCSRRGPLIAGRSSRRRPA